MKQKQTASPAAKVKVGDLTLYHGTVCEVVEKVGGLGLMIKNEDGELIAYNAKAPISPEPKRIWILEQ